MLRTSLSARRRSPRALGFAAALGLALAGAYAVPAAAQGQPAQAQVKASKDFGKVYQPIADIANAASGDYAAARAQLPALTAAIASEDDRYLAGFVTYLLGNKLKERPLEQQGLEMMLQSGKATPAAAAEMNYFLGEWAYNARDWNRARTYLKASRDAGYTEGNAEGLIAESYFQEGQGQQGLAYLEGAIQQRKAAGQDVPDIWIRRGLKVAYDAQNADEAAKWSALLVANNPTADNWVGALQVIDSMQNLDRSVKLDLLRLMALTDSLKERRNFMNYIDAADPRVMANEVSRVLQAGKDAGVFSDSEGQRYYDSVKQVVDQRIGAERADADEYAASAAAAANGRAAQNAGELYLALQDYPKAEELLQLALTKGGIDRDTVLTRLGIAQVQQGKLDAAKATFGQITGTRASVARMWTAYIESRA